MNPTSPTAQAHADAGPTELAARRKASRFAGTLRGRVLAAVVAAGDFGLTIHEALEGLNLPERKRYSAAPRFSELVRDGYVTKSAIVRDGAAAYIATDAGIAWAAEGVEARVQAAADLRAAAEVLRRDGWTQQNFHRWLENGPCHCAEGAIAVATGRHVDVRQDPFNSQGVDWTPIRNESDRHFEAVDALAEELSVRSVPGWNDAPGRTADEVIAALEAAADAAEAQP